MRLSLLVLVAPLLIGPGVVAGVEFSVFGDASLHADTDPAVNSGAELGQLDFFVSQSLDAKTQAVLEVVLEGSPEIVVDLERLYLRHDISDRESITVGRIHTPVGTYNQRFHHGTFLQEFTGRPLYLDFEDGGTSLYRMHGIGAFLHSERLSGSRWAVPVDIGFGNAGALDSSMPAGQRELSFQTGGELDRGALAVARIGIRPDDSEPAYAGLFFLHDVFFETGGTTPLPATASGLATGDRIASQNVTGIDAGTEIGSLLLRAEFVSIDVASDIGPDVDPSTAGFADIGFRFSRSNIVSLRVETVDITAGDSLLSGLLGRGGYDATALVWRHELGENHAIKAQITNIDATLAGGDRTLLQLQWSFLVP